MDYNEMELCLYNLALVGCIPVIHIYAIFSVEEFHIFQIGISKIITQCLSDRLRSIEIILPVHGGAIVN